jgi:hypothetical protein
MFVNVIVWAATVAPSQAPVPPQPANPRIVFRMGGAFGQQEFVPGQPVASSPGPSADMKPGPADGPPVFEVRTGDESRIRVCVLDSTLELATSFGPLVIPVRDVRNLDVGARPTPDETAAVARAVTQLLSPDRKERVAGREGALALGGKALAAVRRAKKGVADAEILAGLTDVEGRLVAAMREKNETERPDRDTIKTDGSTFVGTLTATHLRVLTGPFGEQKLKVSDVQSARGLTAAVSADEEGDLISLPPNGLAAFQGQIGKVLRVRVTGVAQGTVWGTGTYTLDSYLPMAAVHAGAIKLGETAVVKIKIVASPNFFGASGQNGVNSQSYGQYPFGAYEFLK